MNARLKEHDLIPELHQRSPLGNSLAISQQPLKANPKPHLPVADEASYHSLARYGVSSKNAVAKFLGGAATRPWLISMAVHSVLFLLLACVISHATGSGNQIVSLNVSQAADDEQYLTTMRSPNENRNLDELLANFEQAKPSEEHHSFKIVLDDSSSISSDLYESSGLAFASDELGSLQHEFEGVSARVGKGTNQDGRQAEFFGIPSQGTNFVFIIDCSRSMRGHKWTRACQELWKSLEHLGNGQKFFVVFFDQEPHLMLKQRFPDLAMITANEENLQKVKNWGRSVKLGPNTFPMESLHCALSLKPDAIYLLSDGEFQDESVGYLRGNNHANLGNGESKVIVPIHTVAFSSEVGGETLKLIALENDGQFRYVK